MDLELKGFQRDAVDAVLKHVRSAQREIESFEQAVLLSAPTGAGKTAIATAVIEQLLEGDSDHAPAPNTTVLWLTDQPELNEQTRRKMVRHSDFLTEERLLTIEHSFAQERLNPGTVYFLNTQKLGKKSGLVKRSDRRTWTLWEAIQNTVDERGQDFLLVIDEAHRGMSETERDRAAAQTIVQRFIKGGDEIRSVPLVLGISATPERFRTLVSDRRILRPYDVPAEEVRDSGLLKQSLLVYHPSRKQPSDYTLLRAAAERLKAYSGAWTDYRTRSRAPEVVDPVLVVQVENAPSGRTSKVSETDLQLAVSVIEAVLGPLDDHEIAHSFQEDVALEIGDGRVVRYIAPPDIQEDPRLRLVFFKTALTTGWDCPRAEVMMSFRRAVDHTNIAQLVGRMVRTPLARKVEDDEFLNSVSLYLPHYDRAGLDKVLGRLSEDDPEFLPPIDVRQGSDRATLTKNPDLADCFELLSTLPTYDVGRARATTSLRRLIKLARMLDRDGLGKDELGRAQTAVLKQLERDRKRLEKEPWWSEVVKDNGTLDLRTLEWTLFVGEKGETVSLVPVTQQNVDDLFSAAGRRLGEGLHKLYWRARADADPTPAVARRLAKLEAFALSQDSDTAAHLEELSDRLIAGLQTKYGAKIHALPADRHEGYRQVRLMARVPEATTLTVFERIDGKKSGTAWDNHLYVDEIGSFHHSFSRSSWEPRVLEAAMAETGFVGWFRFEDRKDWALAVPYTLVGEVRPFYPDLLVFRRVRRQLKADLLDPHDPGRDDWVPKVKGLAKFARTHWASFGRIEAIYVERNAIRRLDLAIEANRDAALAADGSTHLRSLFS